MHPQSMTNPMVQQVPEDYLQTFMQNRYPGGQQQKSQITGYHGALEGASEIVNNFFEREMQHNFRKFAMNQQERAQQFGFLNSQLNAVQTNQNLSNPAKQELQKQILMKQGQLIAGSQVPTDDAHGNFLKHGFASMLGADLPPVKKLKPEEMMGIAEGVARTIGDPTKTKGAHLANIAKAWNDKVSELEKLRGSGLTQAELLGTKEYQDLVREFQDHGENPAPYLERIKSFMTPDQKRAQDEAERNRAFWGTAPPSATTPGAQSAPVSTAPTAVNETMGARGQVPVGATPPTATPAPPMAPQSVPATVVQSAPDFYERAQNGSIINKAQMEPHFSKWASKSSHLLNPTTGKYLSIDVIDVPGMGRKLIESDTGKFISAESARKLGYTQADTVPQSMLTAPDQPLMDATKSQLYKRVDASIGDPKAAAAVKASIDTYALQRNQTSLDGMRRAAQDGIDDYYKKVENARKESERALNHQESAERRTQNVVTGFGDTLNKSKQQQEYNKASAIKQQAETAIAALARDPTSPIAGQQDIVLIKAVAKLSDPQTGVRDQEYEVAENAFGRLQKLKMLPESFKQGDKLTPTQRLYLLKMIKQYEDVFKAVRDRDADAQLNVYSKFPALAPYVPALRSAHRIGADFDSSSQSPPRPARNIPPAPTEVIVNGTRVKVKARPSVGAR